MHEPRTGARSGHQEPDQPAFGAQRFPDRLTVSALETHLGHMDCLSVLTSPECTPSDLAPASAALDPQPFGERLIGTREFDILRTEGRLVKVLGRTVSHFGGSYSSLLYDFARVLAEENGGVSGSFRDQLLVLGCLLAQRSEGLDYFNRGLGKELRREMIREGLFIDSLELGLFRGTGATSSFHSAIAEAAKEESALPEETRRAIKTARLKHLAYLYVELERSPSKCRFDHQDVLLRAFERTGEDVNGPLKEYFRGIASNIITVGRIDALMTSEARQAILDGMNRDGALAPVLTAFLARVPRDERGAYSWIYERFAIPRAQ